MRPTATRRISFPAASLIANDSVGPELENWQTLSLTAVASTSAQGGTVVLADGTITYTPVALFGSAAPPVMPSS